MMQSDKIQTILKAANVQEVEPIWAQLFAKALEGKDVKDLLSNIGSGGGAAPAAAGTAAAPGAAAEEAKEEAKVEGTLPASDDNGRPTMTRRVPITNLRCYLQRRRSPTTTWVSVFSTKQILRRPLLSLCTSKSAWMATGFFTDDHTDGGNDIWMPGRSSLFMENIMKMRS